MYTYIYSAFLQKKNYARKIESIETRLGIFGITGETRRLSHFLTLDSVITDVLKRKNPTVVVVGDDRTLFDVINKIVGRPVPLGFIPMKPGFYGELLGIPEGEPACEVLAARRIEALDVGRIDRHYFLESAAGTVSEGLTLRGGEFFLKPRKRAEVSFANIGFGNPSDGVFETVVFTRPFFGKAWTIEAMVPMRGCVIEGGAMRLLLDRQRTVNEVTRIVLESKALAMIVGKERKFDTSAER